MYIDAAAALYMDSPKLDRKQRLKNYSAKMAELWKRNPQDIEAGSLYALTLISGPARRRSPIAPGSHRHSSGPFCRAPIIPAWTTI